MRRATPLLLILIVTLGNLPARAGSTWDSATSVHSTEPDRSGLGPASADASVDAGAGTFSLSASASDPIPVWVWSDVGRSVGWARAHVYKVLRVTEPGMYRFTVSISDVVASATGGGTVTGVAPYWWAQSAVSFAGEVRTCNPGCTSEVWNREWDATTLACNASDGCDQYGPARNQMDVNLLVDKPATQGVVLDVGLSVDAHALNGSEAATSMRGALSWSVTKRSTVEQGVMGFITRLTGNCFQYVESAPCLSSAVAREVLVYSPPLTISDLENGTTYRGAQLPVAATMSVASDGFYEIDLDPGNYSVLVRDDDGSPTCTWSDGQGNACRGDVSGGGLARVDHELDHTIDY